MDLSCKSRTELLLINPLFSWVNWRYSYVRLRGKFFFFVGKVVSWTERREKFFSIHLSDFFRILQLALTSGFLFIFIFWACLVASFPSAPSNAISWKKTRHGWKAWTAGFFSWCPFSNHYCRKGKWMECNGMEERNFILLGTRNQGCRDCLGRNENPGIWANIKNWWSFRLLLWNGLPAWGVRRKHHCQMVEYRAFSSPHPSIAPTKTSEKQQLLRTTIAGKEGFLIFFFIIIYLFNFFFNRVINQGFSLLIQA